MSSALLSPDGHFPPSRVSHEGPTRCLCVPCGPRQHRSRSTGSRGCEYRCGSGTGGENRSYETTSGRTSTNLNRAHTNTSDIAGIYTTQRAHAITLRKLAHQDPSVHIADVVVHRRAHVERAQLVAVRVHRGDEVEREDACRADLLPLGRDPRVALQLDLCCTALLFAGFLDAVGPGVLWCEYVEHGRGGRQVAGATLLLPPLWFPPT